MHLATRRAAVVAALALTAAVPLGAQSAPPSTPPSTPPSSLAPNQQLARDIYKELIEINTADSVGSVTKAAEALAKRFLAAGFPAADVQVLVPEGKPTKGNLVVRY